MTERTPGQENTVKRQWTRDNSYA